MKKSPQEPKSQPKNPLIQLENFLELYLVKKAPSLPENIKQAIVNFAPWLIIVLIVLAAPVILTALGFSALLAPLSYLGGIKQGIVYNVSFLIIAASLVLEVIAVPGLFNKTAKSWKLIFYAHLVNALHSIIQGNIGGLIIGTGISMYIIFQVKDYYKN